MWTFQEAVEALRRLGPRGWRLGLDRMEELCRRLECESGGTPRYVHVAGTNGKGSTVAFAESILRQKFRTGATYSPYVYNVRERITGPDGLISEEDFARAAYAVCQIGDQMEETEFGGPTEFEAKTAMGFWYWNQLDLDIVVLETGLGGRLDATNIVHPEVSVITSIGLDHTAILGDTLEAIAREKAGIIKPGVPVVLGNVYPALHPVFDQVAQNLNAGPVYAYNRDWHLQQDQNTLILVHGQTQIDLGQTRNLQGPVQDINAGTAALATHVGNFGLTPAQIRQGIESATLPGRFEVLESGSKTYIFDGAHNVEAVQHLRQTLDAVYPDQGFELIVGMLEGHNPQGVFQALAGLGPRIHLVPINWTRTQNPETLAAHATSYFANVQTHWSIQEAVQALQSDHVLVTGSFYLLGEVKDAVTL